MPKVSDAHRLAQRERIIDAGLRAATEKGLANVSMGDVIRGSGLSAGAIYGYFDSKEQLIAQVASETIATRTQEFDAARSEGAGPGQLVSRIVCSIPEPLVASGVLVQVWAEGPGNPLVNDLARSSAASLTAAISGFLAEWLQSRDGVTADQAHERAGVLTPAVVGLVHGYFVARQLHTVDADAYLAGVDALLASL